VNGNEIIEGFSLEQFVGKKYVLFFFFLKDFTFVCPTDLHALQTKLAEFEARDCKVVPWFIDSAESHWSWLQID